jgi:two-component system phosphate regulon sensor histidine kinase PhoR
MKRKIYILFLFLILFSTFLTGLMNMNLVENNYIKSVEEKLISNTRLVIDTLHRENIIDYDKFSKEIANVIDVRITIIDKDGKVLGDSDANIHELGNHSDRLEIMEAYKSGVGKSKRFSGSLNENMYYIAVLDEVGKVVVRLSVPLLQIDEFNKRFFIQTIIFAVIGIVFAFLLGFRFLKTIVNPINELSSVAKSITSGDYGQKVFLNSDDEIGELAKNFNKMSEELKIKIDEINEKSDETNAILSSMINGVIAINNEKEIMFINESVVKIFENNINVEDVKGKKVLEIFRNDKLDDSINEMINNPNINESEIHLNNLDNEKILKIFLNEIISTIKPYIQIGFVIMIQDITEILKLENMRKEFVSNVSHEIKTPLTSIRGFVETLKDMDDNETEMRKRFLDIIELESIRLNNLIDDLLVISEIEKGKKNIEFEKIDIKDSLDEIILILNQLAFKKNIEFEINLSKNLPNIYGNSRLFKQILINLVDNGIKYTSEGGKVLLIIECNKNECIFIVKDTGIGIEKKHLSRLFERFYRVDKSRSRKVGGTGLGLSIVKHAVSTFNGEITVNSKINKGTEFIVKIPIKL